MRKSIAYIIAFFILLPTLYFGALITHEYFFQCKNYRAYTSPTHHKRLLSQSYARCWSNNRTIPDSYPFSGGGRVNFTQMENLKKQHGGPVLVVNLRDENGIYFGHSSLSHYGIYRSHGTYKYHKENKKKKHLLYKIRRFFAGLPQKAKNLEPTQFLDEKGTLNSLGINYVKFDILRKEFATRWGFVDNLIKLFEASPEGTWMHFHCAGGRGRTTTILILYDIFRNGANTPLHTIADHHFCLGGEDLLDTAVQQDGSWSKENLEGRKALIETFYTYMHAPDGYPSKKWSQWLSDHEIPLIYTLNEPSF